MGCGCQGSIQRANQSQPQVRQPQEEVRTPRQGGPGEPGYAWTGPQRRSAEVKTA